MKKLYLLHLWTVWKTGYTSCTRMGCFQDFEVHSTSRAKQKLVLLRCHHFHYSAT